MTHRFAVPASPAFERIARGAQFRDRIAIVVKASPKAILQALHDVALRDMKLAWALGEIRYLPSRLGDVALRDALYAALQSSEFIKRR